MAVSRINEAGLNVNQYGNRNIVINGAMQVAQRGTSSTGLGATSGYYTVDRINPNFNATAGRLTMTQETITDLPGFANCVKFACTTADTSIGASEYFIATMQAIEGQNLQQLAKGTSSAKKVTVSFYVKGNAAATYVCELQDSNSREISKSFSVTTDWTRVVLTFDADTSGALPDTSALGMGIIFWLHAGSNFNSGSAGDLNTSWSAAGTGTRAAGIDSFFDSTSRTFFVTGLQMEVGDTATDFEHRTFADEVARCQRYFNYTRSGGTASNAGLSNSYGNFFPQAPMRAAPTATAVGNDPLTAANFTAYPGGASVSVTATAIFEAENGNTSVRAYVTGTNSYTYLEGFISLDAEL